MKYFLIFILFFVSFLTTSCSNQEDRQEVLSSFRALGIKLDPLYNMPSASKEKPSKLKAMVYLSLEKEAKFAYLIPYTEPEEKFKYSLKDTEIDSNLDCSYEPHHGFTLAACPVNLTIPTQKELKNLNIVKFGVAAVSENQIEYINGVFLVVPPGSPELKIQNPKILAITPEMGSTHKKDDDIKLDVTLKNLNLANEPFKIGWFVDSGEIENRRASSTVLKKLKEGPHSVLFTIRGLNSLGFDLKAVDINVE